jgi:DnaJ-class molecular chaperone
MSESVDGAPCGKCHGSGNGEHNEPCQQCGGSGKEAMSELQTVPVPIIP